MFMTRHRYSLILLLVCLVLACLPLEHGMGAQLTDMLKVTLSVYALARGLNAVISVAQGTEMSIEPMGVGITLAPGEILDPLNDLIEQFSSVLLVASASIGVQQILLLMGDLAIIRIILVVLTLATALIYILPSVNTTLKSGLFKVVMVLTLLRLAVPVMGIVSYQTQEWLSTEREEAVSILETTRTEVAMINQQQEADSNWFKDLREQFDMAGRLDNIKQRAEKSVEAAVYLLAEFILVMLLMPVLFVWFFVRLALRLSLK